jgi:putative ABC transport system substrate-binding protein
MVLFTAVMVAACNSGIAQTGVPPKRLGILAPISCPTPGGPTLATTPLLQALAERGWIEGRTLVVDCVAPGSINERVPELAAALVSRKPDVLFGATTRAVRALKQGTTKIPIVTAAPDPLRSGIVMNLAHPEANVTGVAPMSFDLVSKRAELLKDLLPRFSRLAVIYGEQADAIDHGQMQADLASAARALGFSWKVFYPTTIADIGETFEQVEAEGFDAAYIWPSSFAWENRARIGATALQYRLPTISDTPEDVAAGVLLSYGLDNKRLLQSAAEYVDKILRGAKPDDLPLQQPTKLELVINLRIAKALGLSVPQSMLLRADEVIE